MKKILVVLIFIIVSLSNNDNVYAQTDSTKVEYKQENIDSSDFSLRRKYKYLDIILKEEKNLFKIGIQPSVYYTERNFKLLPHIVFEKKISTEWSIIIEDIIEYSINNSVNTMIYNNYYLLKDKALKNSLNFGTRYYYGMKKSVQKKISGNNFNSNYFEFNVSSFPTIKKYDRTFKEQIDNDNYNLIPNSGTSISFDEFSTQVSWGVQRRLNNYSFIDAKFLVNCQPMINSRIRTGDWYIGINIIFGFGFNIKR